MAMEELDSKHDWFKRAVQRSALLEREDTILQVSALASDRLLCFAQDFGLGALL